MLYRKTKKRALAVFGGYSRGSMFVIFCVLEIIESFKIKGAGLRGWMLFRARRFYSGRSKGAPSAYSEVYG